jgi:hypothetical protein
MALARTTYLKRTECMHIFTSRTFGPDVLTPPGYGEGFAIPLTTVTSKFEPVSYEVLATATVSARSNLSKLPHLCLPMIQSVA